VTPDSGAMIDYLGAAVIFIGIVTVLVLLKRRERS
jgi:hypothetical protein